MHVRDPIAGMRAIAGVPEIHYAFFIAILTLKPIELDQEMLTFEERACGRIERAVLFLQIAHSFNFVNIFIGCARYYRHMRTEVLELFNQYISMLGYIFAIFYTFNVWFLSQDPEDPNIDLCTEFDVSQKKEWIRVELLTFFASIMSAMVFTLLSKILDKKPDSIIQARGKVTETNKSDLTKDLFMTSDLTYDLYAIYAVPIGVSLALDLHTYKEIKQYVLLRTIIGCNCLQLIWTCLYIFSDFYKKIPRCLNYSILVLLFAVMPIIILSVISWILVLQFELQQDIEESERPQIIEYNWLLAIAILVFTGMIGQYWRWKNFKKISAINQKQQDKLNKQKSILHRISTKLSQSVQVIQQIEVKKEPIKRIDLDKDYFAFSYCSFIKWYQIKYGIVRTEQAKIFYSTCFIFSMQCMLVGIVGHQVISNGEFTMVTFSVLVVRLVCALLLHLQMLREIRVGLLLFKYWVNHSNNIQIEQPRLPDLAKIEADNKAAAASDDVDNTFQKEDSISESQSQVVTSRQAIVQDLNRKEQAEQDSQNQWHNESDSKSKDWAQNIIKTLQTVDEIQQEAETDNNNDADTHRELITEIQKTDNKILPLAPIQEFDDQQNDDDKIIKLDQSLEKQDEKLSNKFKSEPNKSITKSITMSNIRGARRKTIDQVKAQIEGEVETYRLKKSFTFTHRIPPLLIAIMRILSAYFTEVINIAVISSSNDPLQIVLDYIALGIVTEIDTMYAEAMSKTIYQQFQQDEEWQPVICFTSQDFSNKYQRKCWNKLLNFVYKFIKLLYDVPYYYFLPFSVVYMNYYYWGVKDCRTFQNEFGEYVCGN